MRYLKYLGAACLILSVATALDAAWYPGCRIFRQNGRSMSRRSYSYAPATPAPPAAPAAAAPAATVPVPGAPAAVAPSATPNVTTRSRSYRSNSYQPSPTYQPRSHSNRAPFWKEAR